VALSSGEELYDILNRPVSLVIGSFEFALGPMGRVGAVMETAVSKRAAQTLVEKQEQQSDLNAFAGEAVGVASAVTFEQAVAFELAQVVAKLVQAVGLLRKLEAPHGRGRAREDGEETRARRLHA
jgi:hypothetical protein